MPSKFYSYCAAGTPVLFFGPRHSEIGEAVEEHRLGVVVEIDGDVPGSVDYVDRLVSDENLYREVARNCRDYASRRGGARRAVNAFLSLVEPNSAT